MLASPLPVYLGCAGLIVGCLGLGAQYLVGGNSVGATNETSEQPLFARSVEEAALPTTPWPSQDSAVAHYGPMVELLSQPSRATVPTTQTSAASQDPPPAADAREAAAASRDATSRDVVRDVPQQQARQSRRSKNARARDEARVRDDADTAIEPAPRDARADALVEERPRGQERQRGARQGEATETRDARSRRYERRSRDRDDAEVVDTRPDRRFDERRPREVVREEVREPAERYVRGAEPREGFSPFRMFGIFEQR
jgi:hypothetical protein